MRKDKKGLTWFDRRDKIIKSSRATTKQNKKRKKRLKNVWQKGVKHDKLIKSQKEATTKFFEN